MKSLGWLVLFAAIRVSAAPCVDCNVILISLDTVGAKYLGAYGSKLNASPNLDRFAAKGRVYSQAYSPAPWTLPSHGAMLTGYTPWNLGLIDERDRLPAKSPILAQTLKNAGYATFAVTSGMYVDADHGFNRGFDTFKKIITWKDSRESVDATLSWIDKNRKKKFFAFIHSYHAHEPFVPSAQSLNAVDPEYKGPLREVRLKAIVEHAQNKVKLSDEDLKRLPMLYAAGIRDQDDQFGRLYDAIEKWGLDKNTIVIVTSDHGEGMGEHGFWGLHAFDVHEELLRVPLIVRTPQASAKTLETPVGLIDIVPTIHQLLRIKGDYRFDGQPLIETDANAQERFLFAETAIEAAVSLPLQARDIAKGGVSSERVATRDEPWKRVPKVERMVRLGAYKLILKFDRRFELYDLSKDAGETTNIISKEPAQAERLKTLMLQER